MRYPLGNIWFVGDSKTYGVTDPPGSCGPRDPLWVNQLSKAGASMVGTLLGGADGAGGNLTPCTLSGLALESDGHSGFHCLDVTQNVGTWFAALSESPPNMGVLYIGTNDLVAIASHAPGFNIDRLYTDFATCLQTCLALNATLPWIICNLDPMPSIYQMVEFAQFQSFIAAQVLQYQRQGRQIYRCDLYSALQPTTFPTPGAYYNSGGIHQTVSPGYSATGTRMGQTLGNLS